MQSSELEAKIYEMGKQIDSLITENRGLEAAIVNREKFASDAERVLELGRLTAELDSWKERIRMTEFLEQENQILRSAEEATQQLIMESNIQTSKLQSLLAEKEAEIAILSSDLKSQQERLLEEQTRTRALQIERESLLKDNRTCNSLQIEEFREQVREFEEEKEKVIEENEFNRREVKRLERETEELRNRLAALESLLVRERDLRLQEIISENQTLNNPASKLEQTAIKQHQQESTRMTLGREEYERFYKQALDISCRNRATERFSDYGAGSPNPSTIRQLVDLCASGYRGQPANKSPQKPDAKPEKTKFDESAVSESSSKGFLESKKEKIRKLKEVTKRLEEGVGSNHPNY